MIVTTEFIAGVRNTMGTAIFNSKTLVEYNEIYAYALILIILVVLVELLPSLIVFVVRRLKNKSKKNAQLS